MTYTRPAGYGTIVASAPSQPKFSPPKVSRQPLSQPVPVAGECGARSFIFAGSRLLAHAAYRFISASLIPSPETWMVRGPVQGRSARRGTADAPAGGAGSPRHYATEGPL